VKAGAPAGSVAVTDQFDGGGGETVGGERVDLGAHERPRRAGSCVGGFAVGGGDSEQRTARGDQAADVDDGLLNLLPGP
jgi:hypothetical protein